MADTDISAQLADLLGPDAIGRDASIPGAAPLAVCSPADEEGLAATVAWAAGRELPVYPFGLGLRQSWGHPVEKPGIVLKTDRLRDVVEYNPDDLTITVQAGMDLAALGEVTGPHNQRLALDPAGPERTTIGGMLATGVSGPRRFGHGTVRDAVLGVWYVDAGGRKIKAGGKVVKNVAGYDICKLMTGSLGTVGVIAGASFILRPIPETIRLAIGNPADARAAESALASLMAGPTRPVILELVNETTAADIGLPNAGLTLIVGYEDVAEAVDWQVDETLKLANDAGWPIRATDDIEAAEICASLRDWPLTTGDASFKATVTPGRVASFFDEAHRRARESGVGIGLLAEAGNGIIWGRIRGASDDSGKVAGLLGALLAAAVAGRGNMVVTHVEPALADGVARWGRPGPEWELTRRIKEALDPQGILNPGRFVGGV